MSARVHASSRPRGREALRSRAIERVLLATLAHAVLALSACTSSHREVMVTVRSNYASSAFAGVDRYDLALYRRNHHTARWERQQVAGTGVFVFSSSTANLQSHPPDASESMVWHLPDEFGRHLLVAAWTDDEPVLVVATPGSWSADATFAPTGVPVAAQFVFPTSGRGSVELDLEEQCRDVDLVATLGARAPYYRCVVDAQGCAVIEPICVDPASPNTPPRTCAEEVAMDGGTAECPAPGATSLDGSVIAGDASTQMTATAGEVASTTDCANGRITCGANGQWSRCVGSGPCEPGGETDGPCCPAAAASAPQCPALAVMGQPVARTSNCHPGGACDEGTCRACGVAPGVCCPGGTCVVGECDATNHCVCGEANRPCCASGPSCAIGLACDGARCVPCGFSGLPCCATGAGCTAGLACVHSTHGDPLGMCTPCGGSSQPCCPNASGVPTLCTTNLACDRQICGPCGSSPLACCPGTAPCSSGEICDSTQHCAPCGTSGLPCCQGSSQCASSEFCDGTGHCAACGTTGLPCCPGSSQCGSSEFCDGTGHCAACGTAGLPCCPGSSQCAASEICDGTGHCAACGASGEVCCAPPNFCAPGTICSDDGRCHNCGYYGEACCSSGGNGSICFVSAGGRQLICQASCSSFGTGGTCAAQCLHTACCF